MTGYRNYCGECGESKAIKEAVPKSTDLVAKLAAQRFFFDTRGPFPVSAGKSCYCVIAVGDHTGMMWPMFSPDRRGETTATTMRKWANANRTIIEDHGGWDGARFDNAGEFASAAVKKLLLEWGVKAEYTPPGVPKRNGKGGRLRWSRRG